MKRIDPRREPVKWGLYFGVVFGLTYGLVWSILHYIRYGEFTWFAVPMAVIGILLPITIGFIIHCYQKRESRQKTKAGS